MVAVAAFLERGHLNAPHTSSLSQDSLLKALLTQTQQHRTLPQWQPCLLPLKLHPVTRRSWTKHISLPPLQFPKFGITVSMQELCWRSFLLSEKAVREFGGWQPCHSCLLEETHIEFEYVGTFEHTVTYKWHILYAWWTGFKSLVIGDVAHQCVTCFRKDQVSPSTAFTINHYPLSQTHTSSSLNQSLSRLVRVRMAAHRWHYSVPQWPTLARHIDRAPLPEPYFIHPWNN